MTQDAKLKAAATALEWYREHGAGCRKIGSDGDEYRRALNRDGGKRAREALDALLRAPEAAEPACGEPVAWMLRHRGDGNFWLYGREHEAASAQRPCHERIPLVPASALASSLQRIADLERERDEEHRLRMKLSDDLAYIKHADDDERLEMKHRAEAAEALLAKAQEALRTISKWPKGGNDHNKFRLYARAALAQEGRE